MNQYQEAISGIKKLDGVKFKVSQNFDGTNSLDNYWAVKKFLEVIGGNLTAIMEALTLASELHGCRKEEAHVIYKDGDFYGFDMGKIPESREGSKWSFKPASVFIHDNTKTEPGE